MRAGGGRGGVFGLLGMDIFKLGDNKGENRQSFVVYSPPPHPPGFFFLQHYEIQRYMHVLTLTTPTVVTNSPPEKTL